MDTLPTELVVLILSAPELVPFYGMLRRVNKTFDRAITIITKNPSSRRLALRAFIKVPRLWTWALSTGELQFARYADCIKTKEGYTLTSNAVAYLIKYAKLSTIRSEITQKDALYNYAFADQAALRGSLSVYTYICERIDCPTSFSTAVAAIQGGNTAILGRLFLRHRGIDSWAPYPQSVALHYTQGQRGRVFRDFAFVCIDANLPHMFKYIAEAYLPNEEDLTDTVSGIPEPFSLDFDHIIAALENKVSKKFILDVIARTFNCTRIDIFNVLVYNSGAHVIKSKRFRKSTEDLRTLFKIALGAESWSLCAWLLQEGYRRGMTPDQFQPLLLSDLENELGLRQWHLRTIQRIWGENL